MSKKTGPAIPDPQSSADTRGIDIDMVGVRGIRYPITVLDKEQGTQHTVGTFDLFVNLPHRFKGTHMSRFVEILNRYHGAISIRKIPEILAKMKERLEAEEAHIDVSFPYFIRKKAPVSGAESFMEYACTIHGYSRSTPRMGLTVVVPVTTLCPCSKEISEQGAHNQRSTVTISVQSRRLIWIEDIVAMAEGCASCEIYPLLKREDEKFVTERAYRRPRFVEDIVRAVAARLRDDPAVTWYRVDSENWESIHSHNVYARIEKHGRKR